MTSNGSSMSTIEVMTDQSNTANDVAKIARCLSETKKTDELVEAVSTLQENKDECEDNGSSSKPSPSSGKHHNTNVSPSFIEDENAPYVYKDYADVPPPSPQGDNGAAWDNRNSIRENNSSSSREPNFPMKLHSILSHPEFKDVICWMPHGRSWRVLKPKAFEERVIPLYFRHGQYSSFARQVNGWGFNRITQGADCNSYYHEFFLRGRPFLCQRMRRPSSSKKRVIPVDEEPDFHQMIEVHELSPPKVTSNQALVQTQEVKKDVQPFANGVQLTGPMNIQIKGEVTTTLVTLPNGGVQRVINAGGSVITINGPGAIGADPAISHTTYTMHNHLHQQVPLANQTAPIFHGGLHGLHNMPYMAPYSVHRSEMAVFGHNGAAVHGLKKSCENVRCMSGLNGASVANPRYMQSNISTVVSTPKPAHPTITISNLPVQRDPRESKQRTSSSSN